MSFDWTTYLTLARDLASRTTDPALREADLRASISRSYYASFCTARNFLRDVRRVPLPRDDVHKVVITLFQNSPNRTDKKIGTDLDRMRRARNRADYDDDYPSLDGTTRTTLAQAQQTIEALRP